MGRDRFGTKSFLIIPAKAGTPHSTMAHAITREKRLKKWNRAWKISLIAQTNADWRDLAVDLGFTPLPSRRIVKS